MFKKFTNGCVRVVNRWLPDAFLFAIILSIIVFIGSMCATKMGPLQVLNAWGDSKGFWGLLSFSMQMALVLVFGSAMAAAKPCKKALRAAAGLCHNNMQAIVVTTFISTLCCWLNWGFGLIAGTLLAKEVVRRVPTVDYPLLIASAYSGFVIWHAGLSGSIPLDLVAGKKFGEVLYQAPITDTVFHPMNLIMVGVILFVMPLVNYAMHPDKAHTVCIDPTLLEDEAERTYEVRTPADKLEHSKLLWGPGLYQDRAGQGSADSQDHLQARPAQWCHPRHHLPGPPHRLHPGGRLRVHHLLLCAERLYPGPEHREHDLPVPGYSAPRRPAPLCGCHLRRRRRRSRRAAAVPLLCRYHGHDGGSQRPGRVSGGCHLPVLRERLQQRHLPHAVLPGSRCGELLRSLRRRPVGRAGPHHDACRARDIMGYLVIVTLFVGVVACLGFLAWAAWF